MKNTLILGFSLIILVLVFSISCDRIENPVVNNNPSLNWSLYPDADTTTYPWPIWEENTNQIRNVLLEDFTGHTCTNCPAAAVVAKNIENANGGKVIVTSVHASTSSGFQVPSPPTLPLDHRTEAGNAYANAMTIAFNPSGTVNRTITSGNYYLFVSDWNQKVNAELAKTPDFNIQVQYNYFEETRGLFLHTECEVLNNVSGDYSIISFLSRDKVIAPQKDVGGVTIYDYEHHAVLSDNINGTWGTPIITGGATSGTKLYNNFSYEMKDASQDSTYKIDNISIITVISDRNNYEILQVVKTELEE